MRIMVENDQTDPDGGLITLVDDHGKPKRYVRRNRNGRRPEVPDLVRVGKQPLDFVKGNKLDGRNLPDRLVVAVQDAPPPGPQKIETGVTAGGTDWMPAYHEYEANERAFWIWEKFRDRTMRESSGLDVLEIKKVLDVSDPQTPIWTVKEVEAEKLRWLEDKGEA